MAYLGVRRRIVLNEKTSVPEVVGERPSLRRVADHHDRPRCHHSRCHRVIPHTDDKSTLGDFLEHGADGGDSGRDRDRHVVGDEVVIESVSFGFESEKMHRK